MQVTAFIPIKKYSHSKGRLASILSEQQRSDLSKAMAAQTIKALIQSNICDSITLVTNDPHLIIEGASTFFTESSLNQALNEAIACKDSNNPILIMHADLPRINERDLDNLVTSFNNSFISIVPDSSISGTMLINDLLKEVTRLSRSLSLILGKSACIINIGLLESLQAIASFNAWFKDDSVK